MQELVLGRFRLPLDRPLVMGIVNVTPDSFSDGGLFASVDSALEHARRLVEDGADILDVGGESTRPGAESVPAEEELRRVLPVVEALAHGAVPVSVDTWKPEVMREAIRSGASMINDVNALLAPGALDAVAASDVGACLMHMKGSPKTMQIDPRYDDVLAEVLDFLRERVASAEAAGISRARIVVDPGFGFGKTVAHNLTLLRRLGDFGSLGVPVLAGLSRKSILGTITRRSVGDRVHSSVAAALMAVCKGARIVRVHDVRATREALEIYGAVEG